MQDEEIAELKSKMDDMAEEFGEMLRVRLTNYSIGNIYFYLQETLEKMRERIEVSNSNFDGPDLMIQQRMEELKLPDSQRVELWYLEQSDSFCRTVRAVIVAKISV